MKPDEINTLIKASLNEHKGKKVTKGQVEEAAKGLFQFRRLTQIEGIRGLISAIVPDQTDEEWKEFDVAAERALQMMVRILQDDEVKQATDDKLLGDADMSSILGVEVTSASAAERMRPIFATLLRVGSFNELVGNLESRRRLVRVFDRLARCVLSLAPWRKAREFDPYFVEVESQLVEDLGASRSRFGALFARLKFAARASYLMFTVVTKADPIDWALRLIRFMTLS